MSAMQAPTRHTPNVFSALAADEPAFDLVHLERQTEGDAELQHELLALFDRQSASLLAQSANADSARRQRADAAHKLRGSALAVGAGAVARAAAAFEAVLADGASGPEGLGAALAALRVAVETARAALARLRG